MELKVLDTNAEVNRVVLDGKLDAAGIKQVEASFVQTVAGPMKPAVLDMSRVPFVTSMGIGLLLRSARTLASGGLKLILLSPQPVVEEVMNIAGLNQLIPIAHSEEAAAELLGS